MCLGILRALGTGLALLLLAGAAHADADLPPPAPPWPGSFIARLEALALLQTLNAELLSHDSATLTLERWCDLHRLASPALIVAEKVPGAVKVPTAEQRQLLRVGANDPVRYRRVRLSCGGHVLSQADNWYVPGRLTADMNRQLETTDVAFGRVVQALHFQRRTLSASLLWSPLPQGWETGTALPAETPAPLPLPAGLLEHRAVLTLPDGTPFSEVVETYTSEVLAFRAPPRP
jgi:chorismate-pyruvate lyase